MLLAGPRPPRLRDHRPETLIRGVGVDHHPVVGVTEIVCSGGIGIHRGEVTTTAHGVQNRKPTCAGRIEPAGGDHRQHPPVGLVAVLVVDVDQLRARRFCPAPLQGAATTILESSGKRVADRLNPLGAKAVDRGQSTIVGGRFEFFQALDAELVVNPLRKTGSDSRHRRQYLLRVTPSLESIEPAPVSEVDHVGNRQAQCLADRRQGNKAREAIAAVDDRGRSVESPESVGPTPIGAHAVGVRVLGLEKVGSLSELASDFLVEDVVGHEGSSGDGVDGGIDHPQSLAPETSASMVPFGPVDPRPREVHSNQA